MAAPADRISFKGANLWADLETLASIRSGDAQYLPCLTDKLSSSSFQIDSREAKRAWGAWVSTYISGVSRTFGAALTSVDNDVLHAASYIGELVTHAEGTLPEAELASPRPQILRRSIESLRNLSAECSARAEAAIMQKDKEASERPAAESRAFADLAARLDRVAKRNASFVAFQRAEQKDGDS